MTEGSRARERRYLPPMLPLPMSRLHSLPSHGGAILIFVLLSMWMTYPLIHNLPTHLPGVDAADNVSFLWATWRLSEWISGHEPRLLQTSLLFAPDGVNLVLHTTAMVPSMVAALLALAGLSHPTAHNIVLLAGLTLNGVSVYALCFWLTRSYIPSVAAGVTIAWSSFVWVHLFGHFNLVHVWPLSVSVLCWLFFNRRPGFVRGVAFAAAFALTLYTDYYLFVYLCLLLFVWWLSEDWTLRVQTRGFRWNAGASIAFCVAGAFFVLAASLGVLGDLSFTVWGARVSLRSARNPLTIAYASLVAALFCAMRPKLHLRNRGEALRRLGSRLLVLAALCLALALPLLVAAARVVSRGDYISQRVLWRSSPPGADAITLLTGHPGAASTGRFTRHIMSSLQIDMIEQTAWLGIAALIAIWGRQHRRRTLRFWYFTAAAFLLIAAGPFLRIAGMDTALPLPWALLRYLPVLSNARIPGRAVVVVILALAVILSHVLARSHLKIRFACLALLLADLPHPVPLYRLPVADEVDRALRNDPAGGAVVELPTGLRDGFGESGTFDHRALVHQMHHGRPLVGGFVARLPARIRDEHLSNPALRSLVLNEPSQFAAAASGLPNNVVLNRDVLQNSGLWESALSLRGYRLQASSDDRLLYRLDSR